MYRLRYLDGSEETGVRQDPARIRPCGAVGEAATPPVVDDGGDSVVFGNCYDQEYLPGFPADPPGGVVTIGVAPAKDGSGVAWRLEYATPDSSGGDGAKETKEGSAAVADDAAGVAVSREAKEAKEEAKAEAEVEAEAKTEVARVGPGQRPILEVVVKGGIAGVSSPVLGKTMDGPLEWRTEQRLIFFPQVTSCVESVVTFSF